MEKLDVLYICDDKFAKIAGISITSLFENNPFEDIAITVYLLLVQVSPHNKKRFEMLARQYHQTIHIMDAENVLREMLNMNIAAYRGSIMTNLRLHFEQFVPDCVQRILYLDCDTIICSSLKEILHIDMKGKLLGMVMDAYGKLLKRAYHLNGAYYNAGVLLINCDKWRNEHWQNRIDMYIQQYGDKLSHPDQDLYNIVCRSEIVKLPVRYNFQTVHRMYSERLYFRYLADEDYYCADEIGEARKRPVILHMVRALGCNPWNEKSNHPDNLIFSHYENLSPWKDGYRAPLQQDFFIRLECFLYKLLPLRCFFPISVTAIKIILFIDRRNKY